MKVAIKTFASVYDICGFSEKEYDVLEGTTIDKIIEMLAMEHCELNDVLDELLFAVNEEYCGRDTMLRNNDVLAVFPPVSGG